MQAVLPLKLLIAEDEIYARKSLVKSVSGFHLEKCGPVLEASNGWEAYEIFSREHPEIVLTDIRMPLMSGLELTRKILAERPSTKVILVSGYSEFKYAQEAVNLGAFAYLLKPVSDEELQKHILKAFQEKAEEMNDANKIVQCILWHIRNFRAGKNMPSGGDASFDSVFPQYTVLLLYLPEKDERTPDFRAVMRESGISDGLLLSVLSGVTAFFVQTPEDAETLASAVAENFPAGRVGLSSRKRGAGKIAEGYAEAYSALQSKIFRPDKILRCREEETCRLEMTELEDCINLVQLYLSSASCDHACTAAGEFIRALSRRSELSVKTLQLFLKRLDTAAETTLQQMHAAGDSSESLIGELDLLPFESPEEVIEYVKDKIRGIGKYLPAPDRDRSNDMIRIAVNYINQNYNREISLKYLACNICYLNTTYLSRLIREKLGISYSDYLKKVRMQKARELLQNRNLTITQVAGLCGYNDTSQFINIFKKEMGMTPRKMRNSMG